MQAGYNSDVIAAVVSGEIITTEQLDEATAEIEEAYSHIEWADEDGHRLFALYNLVGYVRFGQLSEEMNIEITDARFDSWWENGVMADGTGRTFEEAYHAGDISNLEALYQIRQAIVRNALHGQATLEMAREQDIEITEDEIDDFLQYDHVQEWIEMGGLASQYEIRNFAELQLARSILFKGLDQDEHDALDGELYAAAQSRLWEMAGDATLAIYDPQIRESNPDAWFFDMRSQ